MIPKNGKVGQTWDIIYVDEMPDDLKTGDMNKDWGMKVNTPFFIVSNIDSGRYLDLIGTNTVIKRSNGRTSQKWFFN